MVDYASIYEECLGLEAEKYTVSEIWDGKTIDPESRFLFRIAKLNLGLWKGTKEFSGMSSLSLEDDD